MSFERELGGTLLASVARSFYLSLKFLPARIRGAGSLGYLLARATDTVADTEAVPAADRLSLLSEMAEAVRGDGYAPEFSAVSADPSVSAGEAELLGKFGDCLKWLEEVPEWQRAAIRKVLEPIVRGQSDDLQRFSGEGVASLATDAELEQYAYDVAGCVGVFWTDLGFGGFGDAYADRPRDEMKRLGEDYGKGLQLLNILRDLPEDLAAGRCYLPGVDPATAGVEIWTGEAARWRGRCRELLESAPDYIEALAGRRMRFATALPVLIGGETLRRLDGATWDALESGVKVPRAEVKSLMLKAALRCFSGKASGKLARRALA